MNFLRISQTIERALSAAGLRKAMNTPQAWAGDAAWAGLAKRFRGAPPQAPPASDTSQFLHASYGNEQGRRDYRLYVPTTRSSAPAPLLLMLHGCKQNPEDFAAGTRMNELAERHGFLVAYPAQTAGDNGANCWNWFDRSQQARSGIEPSVLAGLTLDIVRTHGVDPSRVFVAGLSAGAAMAVILGATYPDVYRGVAAHSGLPAGAADGVASAFAAMRGRPQQAVQAIAAVPTLVIHGDADATVDRSNGHGVVAQAAEAYRRSMIELTELPESARIEGGKPVRVTTFVDATGRRCIEHWTVGGGAHTWFGGSAAGSYTDTGGPDASAEIVRFFLNQETPT